MELLAVIKDPYVIYPDKFHNWGDLPKDFLNDRQIINAMNEKKPVYIQNYHFGNSIYNITINKFHKDQVIESKIQTIEFTVLLLSRSELVEMNGILVPFSKVIELRDSFTASLGHELRTPLTSIISMVELMSLTELNSKQKDYMKFLNNSSVQLLAIINDILDFNKLETNNMKLEHKPVNLRNCIDSAFAIVAADFANIPLEYITNVAQNIPLNVIADENKIIQILINLIKNSAKFSPNNGKIIVNLSCNDSDKFVFEVIDEGVGIATEDINKLFTPYTQLNKNVSRVKYGGTGLGLIICKKLCKLMNGDISVESAVSKGTKMTFTLELEIAAKQNRHMSVSAEIVALMRDKNVLIVDDTESHRITLMQIVNSWNAVGIACGGATEALALLDMRTYKPSNSRGSPGLTPKPGVGFQLAILDYCMPNMNGRDLAIEIKKRGYEFPIIILSSLNENISGPFILNFKPINKGRLEDVVRSVMSPFTINTILPEIINDRVLVVDDHDGIRFGIKESLNYLGYQNIDLAANGEEAITAVNKSIKDNTPYKIIFMDIIMPKKDGIEATLEINKSYKDLAKRPYIVALTAKITNDEEKYKSAEYGFMSNYMAKPITIESLRGLLKKI